MAGRHGTQRAKIAGIMMTGGAFGSLIGGQVCVLVDMIGRRPTVMLSVLAMRIGRETRDDALPR